MTKYAVVLCKTDGVCKCLYLKSSEISLRDIFKWIDCTMFDIVQAKFPYRDDLRLIVDDNGLLTEKPLNMLASVLYGADIVGDVIVGTVSLPSGLSEPDIYGLEIDDAVHLCGVLQKLSADLDTINSKEED